MRVIKFRVWNKDQEQMEDDKAMRDIAGLYEFIDEANQERDIVLMQYTGLKDKNGKEIYEGDIIRFTPCDCYTSMDEVEIGIIRGCGAYWQCCGGIFGAGEIDTPQIEVIGNIYENPELLKAHTEQRTQGVKNDNIQSSKGNSEIFTGE